MTVHQLARVPASVVQRLNMPSNVVSRALHQLVPGDRVWLPTMVEGFGIRWRGPLLIQRSRELFDDRRAPIGWLVEWYRWGPEDTAPLQLIRDPAEICAGAWVLPGTVVRSR